MLIVDMRHPYRTKLNLVYYGQNARTGSPIPKMMAGLVRGRDKFRFYAHLGRAASTRESPSRSSTLLHIRAALEAVGVEFIDENGGGPGVRLRKRQQAEPKKRDTWQGELRVRAAPHGFDVS